MSATTVCALCMSAPVKEGVTLCNDCFNRGLSSLDALFDNPRQMPKWTLLKNIGTVHMSGDSTDISFSPKSKYAEELIIQANLCAQYHAAVEKALAELGVPVGSKSITTAIAELSVAHEKAKELLT